MKKTILSFLSLILIFVTFSDCTRREVPRHLERSNPESEGVSSKAILTFLDSASKSNHEFHSFMFLRHGKVIAEGWWYPYAPDLKHTLYSTSKSFTSTAIGLAVKEKKLKIEDKVISFFPEYLPDTISPYLSELKIKHLLTMSTGQIKEPSSATTDWIKEYLKTPVEIEPGTKYRYSSMATFMLSAIIQKVTGEKVIDYLTPRLFEPLGIDEADWETNPQGINTGGWGLRLKTEDLAKFGQLYLQKGKWNGRQILPSEWVEEATSLKIYQNPGLTDAQRDSSNDAVQGYCYQFWRAKNNSYMANGAFGQFILIMPEKDAVIVLTAESNDMWGELEMVWKYLYPGIKDGKLPEDKETLTELRERLESLAIPLPGKNINDLMNRKISGKKINFSTNQRQIQSMSLNFTDDICLLSIQTDTVEYKISFAAGRWEMGETTLHGPSIFAFSKNNLEGLPPFKIAGTYTWINDQTLELTLKYIDCLHTRKYIFAFTDSDKVLVDIKESHSNRFSLPPMEAVIQ